MVVICCKLKIQVLVGRTHASVWIIQGFPTDVQPLLLGSVQYVLL